MILANRLYTNIGGIDCWLVQRYYIGIFNSSAVSWLLVDLVSCGILMYDAYTGSWNVLVWWICTYMQHTYTGIHIGLTLTLDTSCTCHKIEPYSTIVTYLMDLLVVTLWSIWVFKPDIPWQPPTHPSIATQPIQEGHSNPIKSKNSE